MCVDISFFVENRSRSLGKNFENVGRATWLGKKRFLVYNPSKGWGYRDLNFLQRIFRTIFGVYKDSHLKRIYTQLVIEKKKNQQEDASHGIVYGVVHFLGFSYGEKTSSPFPWRLFDKIEFCWARAYSLQEAGISDILKKQRELTFKCQHVDPSLSNPNKQFVYGQIFRAGPLQDRVSFKKYKIGDEVELSNKKMFGQKKKMEVARKKGCFAYPESQGDTLHWTANFADSRLFSFCQGPLLAQDELQVLEHPALAHLKAALDGQGSLKFLNGNEVGLITGAYRYASLDTKSNASNRRPLYGNNFAVATQADLLSKLHVFDHPVRSNIFSMAAPHIPEALFGQPYRKEYLRVLLFRAIAAFSSIKFEYPTKKIVVHTGNWGCGAFGNSSKVAALLQLAAGHFSGIDRLEYYPLEKGASFDQAKGILQRIETEHPNMTIDEFLTFLENNAVGLGLFYERGNGT